MSKDKTGVLFFIATAGQAYTWHYVIQRLINDGHDVRILARDYGPTVGILKSFGFSFVISQPIKSRALKPFEVFGHIRKGWQMQCGLQQPLIVGFGIKAALTATFSRRPSILFIDSELPNTQHLSNKLFASVIITPSCYRRDFGEKQIRLNSFKELAYLHPNSFKPDPTVYQELGISMGDRFAILRFGAFEAAHDIGKKGFSLADKHQIVENLSKYARVFISSEGALPTDLRPHRLPIPSHRIHHALYYANIFVGDSGTTTTEAAVLGTPAVRCNSFVGPNDMGNFVELENDYGLIYSFSDPGKAINKAMELVQQPDIKKQWAAKREKLLADKVDVTAFMVDFIENYPESFRKYKREHDKQQ